MDISKLSDQEKSVMLARAMGWKVPPETWGDYWILPGGERVVNTNLYDTANMNLAWRVLNWASKCRYYIRRSGTTHYISSYFEGWFHKTICFDLGLTSADAQRAWLDKILELAIGAGLVELKVPKDLLIREFPIAGDSDE